MADSSTYSVREIANWILDFARKRGQKISNMSLNKLTYFAYEHAFIHYDRKLTNAKIEAWDHGPVFREIYSSFRSHGSRPITTLATRYNVQTENVEIIIPCIAPDDERIIMEAIEKIVHLPAFILRELSHDADGPWSFVWEHRSPSNPGMEITDEIIKKLGIAKKGQLQ